MTTQFPDRLSQMPDSPFYDGELLSKGVNILFKGEEKTNVIEYCISEGWVRVPAGKSVDRKGRPLTIKLTGPVQPWLDGEDRPEPA